MTESGEGAPAPADSVQNEESSEQKAPEMVSNAALTLEGCQERTEGIVAHPDGGPRASGCLPAITRDQVSHEAIQTIVKGVENTFATHGEKVLRANCGGKLAKDETYGFLLADLILGALIPREKAIALGEKLRKENAKVKAKVQQLNRDRARELGRLPAEQHTAAAAAHDKNMRSYLAERCAADLPIPTRGQAAAGVREEVKQEVKQEAAAPPRPSTEPPPAEMTELQQLQQQLADRQAAWQAAATCQRRLNLRSSWSAPSRSGPARPPQAPSPPAHRSVQRQA